MSSGTSAYVASKLDHDGLDVVLIFGSQKNSYSVHLLSEASFTVSICGQIRSP